MTRRANGGLTKVWTILGVSVLFAVVSAIAAGFPINGWRFWVFAWCLSIIMGVGLGFLLGPNED